MTGARLRANTVSGTLGATLSNSATSWTHAAFAELPVVASPNILAITLDPDETAGAAEIVHVTAHTASSTSVTIQRGREGTTARQHLSGVGFVHGPTVADFNQTDNLLLTGTLTLEGALALPGLYDVKASWSGGAAATGDGTTDDTAAIHRARDAAGATGIVYFPPGTYSCGSNLQHNVAGQVWFVHPGATIKAATTSLTPLVNMAASDTAIVSIGRAGTLDGGNTSRTATSSGDGVKVNDVSNVILRDLTIKNFGNRAITGASANNLKIIDCDVLQSGNTSVAINSNTAAGLGDGEDVIVDGCYVDRSEWPENVLKGGGIKIIGDQTAATDTVSTSITAENDDYIIKADHGLDNGDALIFLAFTAANSGAGLSKYTRYFVVQDNGSNKFKVSTSLGGSAVDITNDNTAASAYTGMSYKRVATGTASDDTITYRGHGFSNGDRVELQALYGGTGLIENRPYYVRDATANTMKVAETANGPAVNFTTDITRVTIIGSTFNRRIKIHNTIVKLPVLLDESGGGGGNECIQCQEVSGIHLSWDGNRTYGGSMGFSASGSRGTSIIGNNATAFSKHGIEVAYTQSFTITGNEIDGEWLTAQATKTNVTGDASADTLTFTGETAAGGILAGNVVSFSSLTGGAGLSTGVDYYVVNVVTTGAGSFQLAATRGGSAINFTTDITAATMRVNPNPDHGIVIWVETGTSDKNSKHGTVTGNTIRGLTQASSAKGIRLSDAGSYGGAALSRRMVLANNDILVGGGAYGILVLDSSGVTVSHNIIDCSESGAVAGEGVRVQFSSTNAVSAMTVVGNQVYDATYGIRFNGNSGTLSDILCADNMIVGCTNVRTKDAGLTYGDRCIWMRNAGSSSEPGDAVDLSGNVLRLFGAGSPEGVKTAGIGSLYLRTNSTAGNTTLYVKESGTGNTGWVAK